MFYPQNKHALFGRKKKHPSRVMVPSPSPDERGGNAPADLTHTPCVLDLGSFR